jgi:hypothetical protein
LFPSGNRKSDRGIYRAADRVIKVAAGFVGSTRSPAVADKGEPIRGGLDERETIECGKILHADRKRDDRRGDGIDGAAPISEVIAHLKIALVRILPSVTCDPRDIEALPKVGVR